MDRALEIHISCNDSKMALVVELASHIEGVFFDLDGDITILYTDGNTPDSTYHELASLFCEPHAMAA